MRYEYRGHVTRCRVLVGHLLEVDDMHVVGQQPGGLGVVAAEGALLLHKEGLHGLALAGGRDVAGGGGWCIYKETNFIEVYYTIVHIF